MSRKEMSHKKQKKLDKKPADKKSKQQLSSDDPASSEPVTAESIANDNSLVNKQAKADVSDNEAIPPVTTDDDDDDEDDLQGNKNDTEPETSTTPIESHDNDNAVDDTTSQVVTTHTFASLGVCTVLQEACHRLHWPTATQIQAQVIPEALQGRDIIGLAETGSGKTAAFCIPLLQGLLEKPPARGGPAALILAPTRELALQIVNVVQGLGQAMGVTTACIVGGVDRTAQALALGRHPHVVVATPGRLLDHLRETKGFHVRHVRYLVLDEADRMLSLDFEQELHAILDELTHARQTFLFSATMTSQVAKLQRASLQNPVRIQVSTKFQTPVQLIQSYLFIPAKYKDCYLTYLVNELAGQSILIFGATCHHVQRLALLLRHLGFPAVCLHGQMAQHQRWGALQSFSAGQRTILVCTDVASRGLDLPHVDVVINYDLPGHGKEYIHRVGRTARAGQSGQAIAIVTQYDVEVYQRIEGLLGQKLPAYALGATEETVLILLERVSEAQRQATRELQEQQQLKGGGRGGGNRKRSHDKDGGEDADHHLTDTIQNEVRSKYISNTSSGSSKYKSNNNNNNNHRGGSGGRGGGLHNQRGASAKAGHKKSKRS
jgi:ATP-dependent RNA helicase DDX47/RRP3